MSGAQRILAERENQPSRKRVGLLVDGAPAREGAQILDETGAAIGVVTSGVLSPTLGHPVAMAYVDRDAVDEPLTVDVRGTHLPVTSVPLPFYSRKA